MHGSEDAIPSNMGYDLIIILKKHAQTIIHEADDEFTTHVQTKISLTRGYTAATLNDPILKLYTWLHVSTLCDSRTTGFLQSSILSTLHVPLPILLEESSHDKDLKSTQRDDKQTLDDGEPDDSGLR
jgi:hypothetical protein